MNAHVKTGLDGRGRFAIRYEGYRRIRWIREPECNEYFDRLTPVPPGAPDGGAAALNDAASLLYAGSSALGSVAHVAQAVGSLLQWWELRQDRLNREIQQEADTRLRLTTDLLDRWVLEHSTSEHVDLELSHFLAREALGLLKVAGSSEKVIVPQALLYEFERVREVVGNARAIVVRQFTALEASGLSEIASPIDGAPPHRINFDALSAFYGPPEDEWNRATASKSSSSFEQELAKLARSPDETVRRIFSVAREDDVPLLSYVLSDRVRVAAAAVGPTVALTGLRIGFAAALPVAGLAALVPFAIAALERHQEAKATEGKDAVRELVLFASEVERTRLLMRCWDFVQRLLESSRGSRLLCLEDGREAIVAGLDDGGRLQRVESGMMSKRLLLPAVKRDLLLVSSEKKK